MSSLDMIRTLSQGTLPQYPIVKDAIAFLCNPYTPTLNKQLIYSMLMRHFRNIEGGTRDDFLRITSNTIGLREPLEEFLGTL